VPLKDAILLLEPPVQETGLIDKTSRSLFPACQYTPPFIHDIRRVRSPEALDDAFENLVIDITVTEFTHAMISHAP